MLLAEAQIKLARRNRSGFLVFFIDLSGIKTINDRFGHAAGDRALIDTADVLRKTFRDSDIVARLGGDEFAALAIDASPESLVLLLVRLQDRVRALNHRPGRSYDLSLAVGSARFEAEEEPGIEDLLRRAEEDLSRQRKLKGGAAQASSGGKGKA